MLQIIDPRLITLPMSVSIAAINNLLKSYTDRPDGITGLSVIAVDKNGKTIYAGTSGKTWANPEKAAPVELDTVYWIGQG